MYVCKNVRVCVCVFLFEATLFGVGFQENRPRLRGRLDALFEVPVMGAEAAQAPQPRHGTSAEWSKSTSAIRGADQKVREHGTVGENGPLH